MKPIRFMNEKELGQEAAALDKAVADQTATVEQAQRLLEIRSALKAFAKAKGHFFEPSYNPRQG